MTRRLPAPAPGEPPGPTPPPPPDLEDRPDPTAEPWDDGPEDEDPELPGDDVPDDPEDSTAFDDPEAGDLEELPPLDASADDADDDLDTGTLDDPDLEDLVDLSAPEDHELPILTMQPRVRVDGCSLTGRVDPLAPVTVWAGAPFQGTRRVLVEVGGARVSAEVQAVDARAAGPEIVLGRDVLAGRFLLRL